VSRELRGIKAKKAITAFEKAGFKILRQKGSHVLLYKEGRPLLVIPLHSEDLKVGLLKKEIKKAGMKVDEFKELL
jgi:predicted RNA binding protein YcfA (HicA-like mRNA interferase family)